MSEDSTEASELVNPPVTVTEQAHGTGTLVTDDIGDTANYENEEEMWADHRLLRFESFDRLYDPDQERIDG